MLQGPDLFAQGGVLPFQGLQMRCFFHKPGGEVCDALLLFNQVWQRGRGFSFAGLFVRIPGFERLSFGVGEGFSPRSAVV